MCYTAELAFFGIFFECRDFYPRDFLSSGFLSPGSGFFLISGFLSPGFSRFGILYSIFFTNYIIEAAMERPL